MLLPSLILGTSMAGSVMRKTRSSVLEVLRLDFIKTVRAKGASERIAIFKHALRNALIPLVTQFGTSFGGLLGGAIITEQVFVINGVGTYLITAINNRNYPVVQSTVLVIATIFILINLAVDILYCVIDPRISYE